MRILIIIILLSVIVIGCSEKEINQEQPYIHIYGCYIEAVRIQTNVKVKLFGNCDINTDYVYTGDSYAFDTDNISYLNMEGRVSFENGYFENLIIESIDTVNYQDSINSYKYREELMLNLIDSLGHEISRLSKKIQKQKSKSVNVGNINVKNSEGSIIISGNSNKFTTSKGSNPIKIK